MSDLRYRRTTVGFAGVILLTALSACGGSSKHASSSTTARKPAATTTSTTQPDATADRARAQSLVLVASDLPPEWTGKPHQKEPSQAALDKKLADCVGASDPATETANVDGLDFDLGDAEVSSSGSMAADKAAYEADVAALRGPKLDACLKSLFATELQKDVAQASPGTTISNLSLSHVPSPTYGDVTVVSRLAVDVTSSGKTARLYIDSVQYGQDRAEVSLTFSNVGAPFDAVLEKALVTKAVAKLRTSV